MTFGSLGPMVFLNTKRKEIVMNWNCKYASIVVALIIILGGGQLAVAQVDWTYQGVAVPPGDPGSWNEGRHAAGEVVFDGTDYHMFLVGGPGTDAVDYPWSVGHWEWNDVMATWDPDPANPVLVPGGTGAWDGWSIINIAVVHDGAMFHMWYGATAIYRGKGSVGYATNPTGSGAWSKVAGPLASLEPGDPGEWDDWGLTPSTVLVDGASHRMWYTAVSGSAWGAFRIGHASSTDGGFTWTKHPDPLLEPTDPWEGNRVYFPAVVDYGTGFGMWYSGFPGGAADIGYAVSPDGLVWRAEPATPIMHCGQRHGGDRRGRHRPRLGRPL